MASGKARTRARRAFTLMELLVVIAITAILMTILFIPLSRSLELSARGTAKSQGLDSTRTAMRLVQRDFSNAMEVYPPRPISLWGYNAWTFVRKRPRPANGATPEAYTVNNGMAAFRLPRHQYFCVKGDHYVTQNDIDTAYGAGTPYDLVALATCPRPGHDAFELELRPISPLEPERNLTVYFVGLKNPGRQAGGAPLYENLLLFRTGPNQLNTYTLYRASIDPRGVIDPSNGGTNTDGNADGLDDRWEPFFNHLQGTTPNPNFFYDTTSVTVTIAGQSRTQTRWEWWKEYSRDVLNSETADVVRWVEAGGKYLPHSLVSFFPTPVEEEVAQPNRETFLSASGGTGIAGLQPGDFPPLEYQLTHGHWLGLKWPQAAAPNEAAESTPLPLSYPPFPSPLLVGNTAPATTPGPRVQVLAPVSGVLQVVYDSALATPRDRLIGYDATTGRVQTAFRRIGMWPPVAGDPNVENYTATIDPATLTADLKLDNATAYPGGMPSTFGALKAGPPAVAAIAMITPGSEVVQEVTDPGTPQATLEPLRRVGWTGLTPSVDRIVAQSDLGPDEYSIDYSTGVITLSSQDPNRWVNVANGITHLLVKYRFQANRPDDVVRVSYSTRELMTVNLGVVQFTRRNTEQLPFEVSERVVVRNLKR